MGIFMGILISNHYLNCALLGWFIAQSIKFIATSIKDKKLRIDRFFGSGGMPSSHSALVTGLLTMVFLLKGFSSVEFAIAAAYSFITVYDAANVRYEVGEQAKIINQIIENWKIDNFEVRTKRFKELMGHTKLEVTAGCVLGAAISVTYWLLFL